MQSLAERGGKKFAMIANDGFAQNFDSQFIQFFSQEERVGVDTIRREQFRTNGNNLCFHAQHCSASPSGARGVVASPSNLAPECGYPRRGRPRMFQSSV